MKFILLVMNILYCLSLNATNVEIVLQCESGDPPIYGEDKRTFTLEPRAIMDEGVLSIDTNVSVAYVRVVIKDNNGNVVYSGYDGTTARSHQFAMGNLPEGNYTLEVNLAGDNFVGNFFCE